MLNTSMHIIRRVFKLNPAEEHVPCRDFRLNNATIYFHSSRGANAAVYYDRKFRKNLISKARGAFHISYIYSDFVEIMRLGSG